MRRYQKVLLSFVLLAGTLLTYSQVKAISVRELLGLDNDTAQTTDPVKSADAEKKEVAKSSQGLSKEDEVRNKPSLKFEEIDEILANVNANERKALLQDADKFKQFIQQEANNASVLSAARANKIDKDRNTAFLMKLSAENVLRETYLNKLIASKLPSGFPSEEQVRQYYDKNKDSFYIGERVHVWQIFLGVDPKMSKDQVAVVETKIKKIRQDILDHKIDFADAALKYSEHGPSSTTGGYMGLVKVSDLKPELSAVLLKLPEGKLSEPIKSSTGYHILKRGAIVPKQDVSFEQVKNQIHNLLLKQAVAQLRKAIYDQAAKTYPVDIKDNMIEQWRRKLLQPGGMGAG